MDDPKLLLLKRALHEIQSLKKGINAQAAEPVAIIGMSCRFPAASNNPEAYWEFLKQAKDGVSLIPEDRFNWQAYYDPDPSQPGKSYVREAGFLSENPLLFDARFFGLSPREANDLDPQQRLLLELSWEALEDAGIPPKQLNESQTGVFIGQIGSEYGFFEQNPIDSVGPYAITGLLPSLSSGRIAHHFGFHGPALTVDTACSSSLVSTHLACTSLQNGECNLALAGGVSLMMSPMLFVMLSKVHALAKDGRCKSFDASADGYGRGEGGGILVLKRLSDALRDKDQIFGQIIGSALNQDGPSSGLTVPNGPAQQKVIKAAFKKASISPDAVSYFEAHGTGTSLGDPIEMQAISAIFGQKSRKRPLYIGTVKSNFGHLEAAAGVAGIIKILLSLKHKMIVPNIHLKKLNPRIQLDLIPAIIPLQPLPWNGEQSERIACINSFGLSGTNAHLILSEWKQEEQQSAQEKEYLLALSALDPKALKCMVMNYRRFLDNALDLGNLCFSANVCRQHFDLRIAFLAKNQNELKKAMDDYLEDKHNENILFQSEKSDLSAFEETRNQAQYSLKELGQFYSLGALIDWQQIYNREKYQKLSLPTYPFQKKIYSFTRSTKPANPPSGDPLAGTELDSPLPQKQFFFTISPENLPELKDTHHLMHVGYFIELIRRSIKKDHFVLSYLEFRSAITFTPGKEKIISLIINSMGNTMELEFYTEDEASKIWTLHVKGQVQLQLSIAPHFVESPEFIQNRSLKQFSAEEFYKGLESRGISLGLGDSVKWAETIWAAKNEALARFLPKNYHPGIWDACAQLFHAALAEKDRMFMVHSWNDLTVKSFPLEPEPLWCYLNLKTPEDGKKLFGSFYLFNDQGVTLAYCAHFEMYAVNQEWMKSFLKKDEKPVLKETPTLAKFRSLSPEEQKEAFCSYLLDSFSKLLCMPREELSTKDTLVALGMDSIISMSFISDFNQSTGIDVPITLLMEDLSIEALAQALIGLITEQQAPPHVEENQNDLWVAKLPDESDTFRLFCFPYGGGGASLYKEWQENLPTLSVIPIQLPGRENRFQEQPFTDIYSLINVLEKVITPLCDRPFAFYGHSAGALIAYRLMTQLLQNPDLKSKAKHLFVAAYSAPLMHPNPWYQLFLKKLKEAGFSGLPNLEELQKSSAAQLSVFTELMELDLNIKLHQSSKQDLDFIKLILSKLLADLQLVESYKHLNEENPLPIPISAFHGEKDERVKKVDMEAWRSLTSAEFDCHSFAGDHFFLHKDQSQQEVIEIISRKCK